MGRIAICCCCSIAISLGLYIGLGLIGGTVSIGGGGFADAKRSARNGCDRDTPPKDYLTGFTGDLAKLKSVSDVMIKCHNEKRAMHHV